MCFFLSCHTATWIIFYNIHPSCFSLPLLSSGSNIFPCIPNCTFSLPSSSTSYVLYPSILHLHPNSISQFCSLSCDMLPFCSSLVNHHCDALRPFHRPDCIALFSRPFTDLYNCDNWFPLNCYIYCSIYPSFSFCHNSPLICDSLLYTTFLTLYHYYLMHTILLLPIKENSPWYS